MPRSSWPAAGSAGRRGLACHIRHSPNSRHAVGGEGEAVRVSSGHGDGPGSAPALAALPLDPAPLEALLVAEEDDEAPPCCCAAPPFPGVNPLPPVTKVFIYKLSSYA